MDRRGRPGVPARDYPYLLNVPAGRMSADPDEPLSFLRFLNKSAPAIKAEDFVSRSLYGDYLEELLRTAEAHVHSTARLLRLTGVACALEPAQRGPGYRVELADGRYFSADTVVLACGNPPPAKLPFFEGVREHVGCLADPWRAAAASWSTQKRRFGTTPRAQPKRLKS